MRLTINEIARLSGVSKSTVSKALNAQSGVGEKTRAQILKLVDRLGYHPSAAAQSLVSRRTGNIGLVVPHERALTLDGAYWSTLITAITREGILNGYHLLVLVPGDAGDISTAYQSALDRRTIDGLIVAAEDLDRSAISRLLISEVPFVLIGRSRHISHYAVDVDNYQAAFDMICHMAANGFRRIAMVAGPQAYRYTEERVRGYRDGLVTSGIAVERVIHAAYEGAEARQAVGEMITSWKPDSLFIGAGGDFLFDSLRALRELKILVGDLGVSVFDDYSFMEFITPGITAIRQPLSEMGEHATRMLLSLVEGGEPAEEAIIVPARIVPRLSCNEDGAKTDTAMQGRLRMSGSSDELPDD